MARILIVEDEPTINNLIRMNLSLGGHTCTQRFSGEGVAELAEDIHSQVIATLSRSDTVQEAEDLGKTVVEAFPDSSMAQEYRALAKTLLEICGVMGC